MASGGSNADIGGSQSGAGGDDGLAGADVLTGWPAVAAWRQSGVNLDRSVCLIGAALFLHGHRIRPVWHDRASENPHRLALGDGAGKRVAGGGPSDNRERMRRMCRQKIGMHRIAIDCGIGCCRQIGCRHQRRVKPPSGGGFQCAALGADYFPDRLQKTRARCLRCQRAFMDHAGFSASARPQIKSAMAAASFRSRIIAGAPSVCGSSCASVAAAMIHSSSGQSGALPTASR